MAVHRTPDRLQVFENATTAGLPRFYVARCRRGAVAIVTGMYWEKKPNHPTARRLVYTGIRLFDGGYWESRDPQPLSFDDARAQLEEAFRPPENDHQLLLKAIATGEKNGYTPTLREHCERLLKAIAAEDAP